MVCWKEGRENIARKVNWNKTAKHLNATPRTKKCGLVTLWQKASLIREITWMPNVSPRKRILVARWKRSPFRTLQFPTPGVCTRWAFSACQTQKTPHSMQPFPQKYSAKTNIKHSMQLLSSTHTPAVYCFKPQNITISYKKCIKWTTERQFSRI